MLVPFDQMPETSRLWIYQAERKLQPEETSQVKEATEQFLQNWAAHGMDLKASYLLSHDQFLVLTVDESFSQASGCSIDASVHLIKKLEQELRISFMNNDKVAFLIGDQVTLLPFNHLKKEAANAAILPSTPVFNNTVQNMADFRSKWLVESRDTWVKRYF